MNAYDSHFEFPNTKKVSKKFFDYEFLTGIEFKKKYPTQRNKRSVNKTYYVA